MRECYEQLNADKIDKTQARHTKKKTEKNKKKKKKGEITTDTTEIQKTI